MCCSVCCSVCCSGSRYTDNLELNLPACVAECVEVRVVMQRAFVCFVTGYGEKACICVCTGKWTGFIVCIHVYACIYTYSISYDIYETIIQ